MIMLPKNNIFYARVDSLPLDPRSATWIANDFTGVSDGLRWYSAEQYNAIHANSITPQYLNPFVLGDNIAYPIPNNPRINPYDYDHVLMMYDIDNGMFYNLYATYPGEGGGWTASASQWNDMKTNDLRVSSALRPPEGVLQVKYDEVASGKVNHALQFSLKHTSDAYVWPYFHSNGDPYPISQYPPVGQRFRLKASYDISRLGPEARVIAQALKTYGGIVTDQHGSEANIVQINANYDSRWAGSLGDEIWDDLASIPTNQFEAVDCSSLMVSPNSMEVAA